MAHRKIKVLKVPKDSFNPERAVSGLLKEQIGMLEKATLSYDHSTPLRNRPPETEREASGYIKQLHVRLQQHLTRARKEHDALAKKDAPAARAARARRSTSTDKGEKRWPATTGPSVAARQRDEVRAPARHKKWKRR